jgi:hypothetical protein
VRRSFSFITKLQASVYWLSAETILTHNDEPGVEQDVFDVLVGNEGDERKWSVSPGHYRDAPSRSGPQDSIRETSGFRASEAKNGDSLRDKVLLYRVSPFWHQNPVKSDEKRGETSELKFGANR